MISMNLRRMGLALVVFSLLLLTILAFLKIDQDKKDEFLCDTVHENPELDMNECPVHESSESWLLLIAFGIAFAIFGGGLYMAFTPQKNYQEQEPVVLSKKEETTHSKPIEFKEIDVSRLDEEEKKIYDILRQHEGSMYQSDLIKDTNLSKVQITRVLDKMEGKKILERHRRGMTNIVILR